MKLQLRQLNSETDLPRVVELMNMVNPEPISVDTYHERQRLASQGRIGYAIVALDENAYIVGYISIVHNPWMPQGHFWLRVIVDRALRNGGIGTLLYNHALDLVRASAATHLVSEARDGCAECLQFAQHRGFKIERHLFVSRLYPADFDESRFVGTIEAVEAAGIRFFTLADVGSTLEVRQKLYELYCRCAVDNPAYEGWSFPPFEAYCKRVFESAGYRANGQMIAVDGGNWVGMATLDYYEETNALHNGFTGVDRAYRGRHIALALKLLTIRFARKYDVSYLYTNNDSTNMPMLAVNRKLGYRPEPGIYILSREL